jgi:hypothetical protein
MKIKAVKTNACLTLLNGTDEEDYYEINEFDIVEIDTEQFETLIRSASQDKPISAIIVVDCLNKFLERKLK